MKVQGQPGELYQWFYEHKALSSMPRITEKMKKEKNTREREREINLKYRLIEEGIKLIVFLISTVLFFFCGG